MLFLFITLCNLLVLKAIFDGRLSNHFKLLYWVSMAMGILIKGPIILIFTILPLLALSIIQKRNFFNFIWTKYGFFIFFLISVPWFVLISIKSNGLFWHESVINDLFNKVKIWSRVSWICARVLYFTNFFIFLARINFHT